MRGNSTHWEIIMAKQGLYQFVANDTAAQFVLADGTTCIWAMMPNLL